MGSGSMGGVGCRDSGESNVGWKISPMFFCIVRVYMKYAFAVMKSAVHHNISFLHNDGMY